MAERFDPRTLRRQPREGNLTDLQADILHERAVGVGKLTQGSREVEDSDEDA